MVLNVILSLSFRHYLRPDADCWPLATKRNLTDTKITASRARNYGSFKFIKFVLKIAPNRCPKFGSAQKMLYLCIVNRWSSESHESSLSNGRVATEKDTVNHERQQSGKRQADVDCCNKSLIPWKMRLSESRAMLASALPSVSIFDGETIKNTQLWQRFCMK